MFRGRSCIVAALLLGFVRIGYAGILQGPVVDPANSYTYYLLTADTWTHSQAAAVALGGNLVTVRDSGENTWITTTFASGVTSPVGDIWTGFQDPDIGDTPGTQHAADFAWIDGESITYTNWFTGEPNDDPAHNGEYYGSIIMHPFNGTSVGQWNDLNNAGDPPDRVLYGLVEVMPEPVSLGLVGIAALAATLRRPRRNQ